MFEKKGKLNTGMNTKHLDCRAQGFVLLLTRQHTFIFLLFNPLLKYQSKSLITTWTSISAINPFKRTLSWKQNTKGIFIMRNICQLTQLKLKSVCLRPWHLLFVIHSTCALQFLSETGTCCRPSLFLFTLFLCLRTCIQDEWAFKRVKVIIINRRIRMEMKMNLTKREADKVKYQKHDNEYKESEYLLNEKLSQQLQYNIM